MTRIFCTHFFTSLNGLKSHLKDVFQRPLKKCAKCSPKKSRYGLISLVYLRVSTNFQDLEKNKADILRLANEKELGHVEWIEEKVSGVKDWKKRELGKVLAELEDGDMVIVPELSRLGRSTLQILEIVKLANQKTILNDFFFDLCRKFCCAMSVPCH